MLRRQMRPEVGAGRMEMDRSALHKESTILVQAPGDLSSPSIKFAPHVGLLTGGQDRHYAFGLATALIAKKVRLDVIGNDLVDGPEMHNTPGLEFINLYGNRRKAGILVKIKNILSFYLGLFRYAMKAEPKIIHILWNNKFELLDRTLLMLYFRMLGKKTVITVHNVNAGRRDLKDSVINRSSLEFQYRMADHLFVHTSKMRDELLDQFHVRKSAVTIIPYGINNAVLDSGLTRQEARHRLSIKSGEKALLFFGAIKPYKGLEYLVSAFQKISAEHSDYRLIIAGERKKDSEKYYSSVQQLIDSHPSRAQIISEINFIPDDETEIYFKAADVAVLPYTEIFQSGILFMAYAFGLPVIASDVGSFAEDIIEGRTGLVCRPRDPDDLASKTQLYFDSELYKELDQRRPEIKNYMLSRHSWSDVADLTRQVYLGLAERVS
jgi:glycosyltransferase involved in cell wall biosynthesis